MWTSRLGFADCICAAWFASIGRRMRSRPHRLCVSGTVSSPFQISRVYVAIRASFAVSDFHCRYNPPDETLPAVVLSFWCASFCCDEALCIRTVNAITIVNMIPFDITYGIVHSLCMSSRTETIPGDEPSLSASAGLLDIANSVLYLAGCPIGTSLGKCSGHLCSGCPAPNAWLHTWNHVLVAQVGEKRALSRKSTVPFSGAPCSSPWYSRVSDDVFQLVLIWASHTVQDVSAAPR